MQKIWNRITMLAVLSAVMMFSTPRTAYAEEAGSFGPALNCGEYLAEVTGGPVEITDDVQASRVLAQAPEGSTYEILKETGDGYMMIQVGEHSGYLKVDEMVSIREAAVDEEAKDDAAEAQIQTAIYAARRQSVVDYAMQFLGCPYQYGGTDPNTGVDCSGFTGYVLRNSLGIQLNRTSEEQASQGTPVSSSQMKPGDLLFYSDGGDIGHVALYIGGGQIIHASTYETGVKLSPWNYKTPVKIMNVIGW